MDSRRHRADNSISETTASTTQEPTPHHDSAERRDDLDPTPNHRPDHTDAPTPSPEPNDRPPRPTPTDEQTKPDRQPESEDRDLHSPDRSAEPPSSDAQPDPFASYSPELRAHMLHDDTLSRLQYLSNPLPEPDHTADEAPGEPVDDETDGAAEDPDAAAQPEPARTADTPPDTADSAQPTTADDETATAQADESAQEPTADPNHDSPTPSSDSTADAADGWTDPAGAASPADADRDSTTRADDANPSDDTADPPKPMTLETEVDGEAVGTRLERWDPARLNLPRPAPTDATPTEPTAEAEETDERSVDEEHAVAYIAANKETSPWLAPAADCEPVVQSIYASLDQGTGHAHIRHGPALDQQSLVGRVTRFEDPAQTDPALRESGVDGLDPGKLHYCGRYATAVADPYVFAAVAAGLSEHPDVQEALRSDWDGPVPARLEIPISDLLGVNGHESCIGFRLSGDWQEAKVQRKDWALARSSGADAGDMPEPEAEPVPTFEGGDILVMFKRNLGASKFEISTFFPDPPES